MSQKLIEFLVHFYDFIYNVIACFYVEISTIYQIYILQKFKAEMKIPARIRSENRSMAQVRSLQRIEVATRSHTILNENVVVTKERLLRQKKGFREEFYVTTQF